MLDGDFTLLRPSLARRRAMVNAQAFVPGREATSAIACWNGKVLASLHFEVIEKAHKLGHASVLRLVENREMTLAADRIVRRLSLSGIFGLDFMLEGRGKAHLIEMNPRADSSRTPYSWTRPRPPRRSLRGGFRSRSQTQLAR